MQEEDKKKERIIAYIDALESVGVQIFYGKYQEGTQECKRCGNVWRAAKEKMTDVNIATAINIDAFQDKVRYGCAYFG